MQEISLGDPGVCIGAYTDYPLLQCALADRTMVTTNLDLILEEIELPFTRIRQDVLNGRMPNWVGYQRYLKHKQYVEDNFGYIDPPTWEQLLDPREDWSDELFIYTSEDDPSWGIFLDSPTGLDYLNLFRNGDVDPDPALLTLALAQVQEIAFVALYLTEFSRCYVLKSPHVGLSGTLHMTYPFPDGTCVLDPLDPGDAPYFALPPDIIQEVLEGTDTLYSYYKDEVPRLRDELRRRICTCCRR